MALVNAHTVLPNEIKPGDEMLFVVKAMVGYIDNQGQPRYRLYRCRWDGDENNIPQGDRIDETMRVDRALFPTLANAGRPG